VQKGIPVQKGQDGETGKAGEEEEEKGIPHQGESLPEEEQVEPSSPESEGTQVGVFENAKPLCPGPRAQEGISSVQKPIQVQKPREEEKAGEQQGGQEPFGKGEKGKKREGKPKGIARQGEEQRAPSEILRAGLPGSQGKDGKKA